MKYTFKLCKTNNVAVEFHPNHFFEGSYKSDTAEWAKSRWPLLPSTHFPFPCSTHPLLNEKKKQVNGEGIGSLSGKTGRKQKRRLQDNDLFLVDCHRNKSKLVVSSIKVGSSGKKVVLLRKESRIKFWKSQLLGWPLYYDNGKKFNLTLILVKIP